MSTSSRLTTEEINQIIIDHLMHDLHVPSEINLYYSMDSALLNIITAHGYIAHREHPQYARLESYEHSKLPAFLRVQAG